MNQPISIIAAVAANRVIGKNNDLPWHLPDDMRFFMNTTTNHAVIMGRKNYESLPPKYQPLPNRTNIVITHQKNFQAPGCTIVHSWDEAFEVAPKNDEVFIIGGADIFRQGLPHATRMYLTEIHADVEGDVYFPEFDRAQWEESSRIPHPADDRHCYAFDFVTYNRIA